MNRILFTKINRSLFKDKHYKHTLNKLQNQKLSLPIKRIIFEDWKIYLEELTKRIYDIKSIRNT